MNGFYVEFEITQSGSVTFTQRFGTTLNLNVHFHLIQIEEIYEKKSTGFQKFKHTKTPTDEDIGSLLKKISEQAITLLEKENYLHPEEIDEPVLDRFFEEVPLYAEVHECIFPPLLGKLVT